MSTKAIFKRLQVIQMTLVIYLKKEKDLEQNQINAHIL